MTYYRVKPEFDQKPKQHQRSNRTLYHYKQDIWIENELYTVGELERLKKRGIIINEQYFDKIEIPKSNVHFFFGARFAAEQ